MTKEFEASNGVVIDASGETAMTVCDGMRQVRPGGADVISRTSYLNAREFDALREFFRYERDEELGRWRWPENPDYVVYCRSSAGIRVANERTGDHILAVRETAMEWVAGERTFFGAARAYFEAHPVPKPWHDAKPGEVWAISLAGGPKFAVHVIAALFGVRFQTPGADATIIDPESTSITAARRIFPEQLSDV